MQLVRPPFLMRGNAGGSGAPAAAVANPYDTAILALSPDNYWKLSEDYGSATFTDTQGNGDLSSSGITIAGVAPIVPAQSSRSAVATGGLGKLVAGSSATANLGAADFSILFTGTFPTAADLVTNFLFSKSSNAGSGRAGVFILRFGVGGGATNEVNIGTDDSNYKKWTFAHPVQGVHDFLLTFDYATKTAALYIDGAAVTLTAGATAGTIGSLSNANLFTIGGRGADSSLYWPGVFQSAAVWVSRKITAGEASALHAAHDTAETGSHTLPLILDYDGAATDEGDLFDIAQAIKFDQTGLFDLLGVVATTNDNYGAPASRDILDGRGLIGVPVYAYQGSDIQAATAGKPAQRIRDNFSAADVRANYSDPATGYGTLLTAAADNSVVVTVGGFFNSIAQFLNASAANVTLWNQKVRAVIIAAGQFPNSSDAASPVGNFAAAGAGEWNLGGSSTGGAAESQAAVDFISLNTRPAYWAGIEICGNAGNSPTISYSVTSDLPDVGAAGWAVTDPLAYGWNSAVPRTAWDQVPAYFAVMQLLRDTNPLATVTDILDPTISVANPTYGQNTTAAGSSEHHYFVPRITGMTAAQWRTFVHSIFIGQGVPK